MTRVTVTIPDTTAWENGGSIVIIFGNVTAPVPSSLTSAGTDNEANEAYVEQKFNAKSKGSDGTLSDLRSVEDTANAGGFTDPFARGQGR